MHKDFTLQVNLSPGDTSYAGLSARKLALQHIIIPNRLLIVDCCRPQQTKLVDPSTRFPEPIFSEKVEQICNLAKELISDGLYTNVRFLIPDDVLFQFLSKKYLNNVIQTTHGFGGTAQMAYWAGIELASTRYVLHYDGDMILYQEKGYYWWLDAIEWMKDEPNAIFAIPRHAPPCPETGDLPTFWEGTEISAKYNYWLHNWFSTRFFLLDKDRLAHHLPLVKGKLMVELLLRKYLKRGFPLDPEIIMFRRMGLNKGMRRLILKTDKSWALHPHSKPEQFLRLMNGIYDSVEKGKYPKEQGGYEDLNLDAWEEFLKDL